MSAHHAVDVPAVRLERARRHHEITGTDRDLARVPPRLVASWRRSEAYGVPLDGVDPAFTGTLDDESLFYRCGREVLDDLQDAISDEPISMMLVDAGGLVLNRVGGDTSLLRALDRVHLAPGFSYSEQEAGTNGVGLALADRVPTVVRADEHYAASLCTYTCAAVPVHDPTTGHLAGAVNLTTWSRRSTGLLLALAQSAAGSTASLMLARSSGHRARPLPRGEVHRVESARLQPGAGTLHDLSPAWTRAVEEARTALAAGRVVLAVGEPGSGRATLLAQAHRAVRPRDRILHASTPAPPDVEAWLGLWTPELAKPRTAVVVGDVDTLAVGAAERLRDLAAAAATTRRTASDEPPGLPLGLTAERFEDLPDPLVGLVDTVVSAPPLRDRPDDVLPLALHFAERVRGRPVQLTPAAQEALRVCGWPGGIDQLQRVVQHAAGRSDLVDLRHLPPSVLTGSHHRLSRIEHFEREEIVRVLTTPGTTMGAAAEELGMSRATVYRKLAQYDIHIPRG